MNKRLRKKKLKHSNFIELPLDKLIKLLEKRTPYEEELAKTLKERLGKCFYYKINFGASEKKYNDMLEKIKEKLENE